MLNELSYQNLGMYCGIIPSHNSKEKKYGEDEEFEGTENEFAELMKQI